MKSRESVLSSRLLNGVAPGSQIAIRLTRKALVEKLVSECCPDWETRIWTDPPDLPADQLARTVYVLRSDGLTAEQIEKRIGDGLLRLRGSIMIVAPLRQGYKATAVSFRASKQGWEDMEIGDRRICRSMAARLRSVIGNCMVARDLPFEFQLTRMREMETEGVSTQVWMVERIK